jgi:hypothetical protein
MSVPGVCSVTKPDTNNSVSGFNLPSHVCICIRLNININMQKNLPREYRLRGYGLGLGY